MMKPNTIQILILDESKERLTAFMDILGKQVYEVKTAQSELTALLLAKTHDFALILLPVTPGGNDGFHTVEKLKSNPKTRQVPIILLTDHQDNGFKIKAYRKGAADILERNEDPEVIASKINVFVDLYRLRLETEKKDAERIKNSVAKYKNLFETSRDGIVFLSLDGLIENANKAYCTMIGYPLTELIFMTDKDHTPPQWHAKEQEILESQVLQRDYSDEYRIELIRKNASVFPVMVRTWLMRDNNGQPLRLLKLVRDVTDQTRLEMQLRQAQKMESIGTLAGGIAHDFNNILGAIIGYTQLARYNIDERERALQDIDHVLTASSRAKDLVKHILGFSRLTEHSMQPIQLHHIVKEALKLIRASLPSTIEIKQDIATQGTTILADPTEIHQVIMNFSTNALHAMEKEGGVLEVLLKEVQQDEIDMNEHPVLSNGPHMMLVVRDSGCGIDPHHIERIFDPYFTTKKKGTGTGLGLSVVHGIIHNHGGSINVKSNVGEGTTMTVMLPRLQSTVEKKAAGPDVLPTGHERILFVDDETSLVEIEKVMLQRLGYQVISESSSVSALETFAKNPDQIDLVITDMTMPDMTGLELASQMKTIKPELPIILCTGYNTMITEENSKTAGISLLLLKPVEIKELASAIRKLLDQPVRKKKGRPHPGKLTNHRILPDHMLNKDKEHDHPSSKS